MKIGHGRWTRVAAAAGLVATMAAAARGDTQTEVSEADALNNRGQVTGALCLPGCAGYVAYVKTRGRVRVLGTLGGFASVGFGINDRGVVVGQADTAERYPSGDFKSAAFIADDDGLRSLPPVPGYENSQAFGINDRGDIVGFAYNLDPDTGAVLPTSHAFLMTPGRRGRITVRDLGTLGGATSVARAVNNAGVVVGSARRAAGGVGAFVYADGVMTELPGLGGTFTEALAINDRGDVVGSSTYAGAPLSSRVAVRWRHGVIEDLGTLGGGFARARGINARGDVVGESVTAEGLFHAFLVRDGVMEDLGTLGGDTSQALGINEAGRVVGVTDTGAFNSDFGVPVFRAFVFRRGEMREIPLLE